LQRLGYLKLKHKPGLLARLGITQQRLVQMMHNFPIIQKLKPLLNKLGLFKLTKKIPKPSFENIDVANSKAYAVGFGGQIYIKQGKDYEEVKKRITEALCKIRDPNTGKRVVKRVHTRDELFPNNPKAPDLVVECPNYDAVGFLGYNTLLNTNPIKSGTHKLDGVYVASGAVFNGIKPKKQNITNIAPTILKLYNLQNTTSKIDGESII